ncbi:hypothetical protein [Kangiella sp.]|uniref:hypothetical protein n=1 Tax=Kangiella sp. TaxID=1920245 RepID=UPI003A8CEB57
MADAPFVKADIVTSSNILEQVQEILQKTPGLHTAFTDVSMYAEMGSDSVEFPKVGPVTTQDATGTMEYKNRSYTMDKLDLSIERGHCFLIKNSLKKESKINLTEAELRDGMISILNDRDQSIHDAAAATTQTVERSADIGNDIVDARKILVDNNVKIIPGQQVLLANSTDFAKILKHTAFTDAAKLANSSVPLVTGAIGRIYGFDVMEHTFAETLIASKRGVVYADHGEPDVNTAPAVKANGTEWSEVLKFGVKAVQDLKYVVKLADPV